MGFTYRRMERDARVFVAGHRGMVGAEIVRQLQQRGYRQLVTRSRAELDLTRQEAVERFFERERPEFVINAAAKVGGIMANNSLRAEFIYENLIVQSNVIDAAYRHGVQRLLFLGSSCVYPRDCRQPIREEYLLTGALEPTNEPYAVAKIAGIKMCEAYNAQYGTRFLCVMPTNLYGPGDNYELETCHVLPALIRKFHEAKINGEPSVQIWGTGSARREFLHVEDMADACIFLLERTDTTQMVNIGSGADLTILELASLIGEIVGFRGELAHDLDKPDGMKRKWLDVGRLSDLGWRASIGLREGIERTYRRFVDELH